jgi:hypothetical protein
MNKGILYSVIYYLIGFGFAGVFYLRVEHTYIHGPGAHHIIMGLTFLGGIIWTMGAMIRYNFSNQKETLKGIMITNLVITLALFIVIQVVLK